jgi:hypothetical protein
VKLTNESFRNGCDYAEGVRMGVTRMGMTVCEWHLCVLNLKGLVS